MLAALSASRDRQRQLVADAGHELRTPLTSLRTNLDLLTQADRPAGLSPESRAELLDDVQFQIEELTTLIGDLTELAREEPAPFALEAVDLAEVIERAVAAGTPAGHAAWTSTCTPSPGGSPATPPPWSGRSPTCSTTPPSGARRLGTVTVRLADGRAARAPTRAQGIAEDDLPHVFDRFYRSTESRTMPGSGLGLSIVRAVAERHGGAVRAGAAPGGGAAFWFQIPGGGPASEDLPESSAARSHL